MPTYEYACRSCGEHLEVVQKFSDAPLSECPNCRGQLRKVFGNIGIAFKGSGFYRNDSRSASSGGKGKAKEGAASSSSDKSSSEKSSSEKSTSEKSSSSSSEKSSSSSSSSSSTAAAS